MKCLCLLFLVLILPGCADFEEFYLEEYPVGYQTYLQEEQACNSGATQTPSGIVQTQALVPQTREPELLQTGP